MDIPDDLLKEKYDPTKYAGSGRQEPRQDDLVESKCGSYSYSRFNACLLVYFNGKGLKGGKQTRAFQYVHLADDGPEDGLAADGCSFSVLFAGYTTQRLSVTGTNLRHFYEALVTHRLHSIRSADRPFRDEREPFVSDIRIESLETEYPRS